MPRQLSHICSSYHVLSSLLLQPRKMTTSPSKTATLLRQAPTRSWTNQRLMEYNHTITLVLRNTAKDTQAASGQTSLLKLLYMCTINFSNLFLISELYLHPPRQLLDNFAEIHVEVLSGQEVLVYGYRGWPIVYCSKYANLSQVNQELRICTYNLFHKPATRPLLIRFRILQPSY